MTVCEYDIPKSIAKCYWYSVSNELQSGPFHLFTLDVVPRKASKSDGTKGKKSSKSKKA